MKYFVSDRLVHWHVKYNKYNEVNTIHCSVGHSILCDRGHEVAIACVIIKATLGRVTRHLDAVMVFIVTIAIL